MDRDRKTTLTDHDLELMTQARALPNADWMEIEELIHQADTPQGKRELECILVSKYHRDEYWQG